MTTIFHCASTLAPYAPPPASALLCRKQYHHIQLVHQHIRTDCIEADHLHELVAIVAVPVCPKGSQVLAGFRILEPVHPKLLCEFRVELRLEEPCPQIAGRVKQGIHVRKVPLSV